MTTEPMNEHNCKRLETMTKDERSLLLYFESRAVDNSGRIKSEQMNDTDREIAARWNQEGFVNYGRIASEDLSEHGSHWCYLSEEAWKIAAAERCNRAERTWQKRKWQTTEEKRAA